jgi:hypothetical protein
VNPYGFMGLTEKGVPKILPMFFYSGAGENVPWKNMLNDLTEYGDIVNIIVSDTNNVVKPALAEVSPDTKYYNMVWSLPSDASFKKEIEKLNSEFENMFKKYWRFKTMKDFDEAEKFAEEYMTLFEGHFKDLIKPAAAPQSVVQSAPAQPSVQAAPVKSPPSPAPQAPAAAPLEEPDCCFVFEKKDPEGRIVAVFNHVKGGNVLRSVIIRFPEKINGVSLQDVVKNAAPEYENTIKKAAAAIGNIKYILFRNCTMNLSVINTAILPDTVWCRSIADIPNNEPSRQVTINKLYFLEGHLTRSFKTVQDIEEYLKKLDITVEVK